MIKKIPINYRVCMAPIASITDIAFRQLLDELGGLDIMFTELISADAIKRKNQNTLKMIKTRRLKTPEFVQLFGNDPQVILEAAKFIQDETAFSGIDINMGCPVKKVIKKGAGSALLKDHQKIKKIISLLKNKISLPVTAKIRLGFNKINAVDTVRVLEGEGIDGITVHFRLQTDRYTKPARWEYASELKNHIKSCFIGNGDISTLKEIDQRLKLVDAVMIGRGAVRDPLLFSKYYFNDKTDFNLDKTKILKRFLEILEESFDDKTCLLKFKSFVKLFFTEEHNIKIVRTKLFNMASFRELKSFLYQYLDEM